LLQERNNESLIKLNNLENNLNKIRAKVKEENKRVIGKFLEEILVERFVRDFRLE